MFQNLRNRLRAIVAEVDLSPAARDERRRDRAGLPERDPGTDAVIDEGIAWLGRAQDRSASADGGVARDYSLLQGWATSYPETTGYIVPTLLDYARLTGERAARDRALRMLDWLVAIQLPGGGFQGGKIDATPVVPVTFNTGQIVIGLAAGAHETERYRAAMRRAADWLVATQDTDGCWRKHATPFAAPGEKTYETHVAWGLFEAARVDSGRGYAEAALANVRWALGRQEANGWLRDCCLNDPARPLTHTLGYALRGFLEAYRYAPDGELLALVRRTADGLMGCLAADGRLPGRLDRDWRAAAEWVCLTGSVQVAHCWLTLYQITNDNRYRDAGLRANLFVRRTVRVDGPEETRGAVKGSFPVSGYYGRYEYLNWATKFCIDAQLLERQIRAS